MEKLDSVQRFDNKSNENKTVYKITNKKTYSPLETFSQDIIDEVFEFAYGMSIGGQGHHRSRRTGGRHQRKDYEIFADAFQGKLAEFAIYNTFTKNGLKVGRPDTEMYGAGIWDDSDFNYKNKKISVKSTKHFGNLMLLESADWTEDGLYIPNLGTGNEFFDYFVLARLEPFALEIMNDNNFFDSPPKNKEILKNLISYKKFTYDIPGFITRVTIKYLITENFLVSQGNYINQLYKGNKLDADNYYIQVGDLHSINGMINDLKKL